MEKEIKVNEKETQKKELFVEREKFTSKDKEYYSYMVKGKIRGRDVRVDLIPKDKGGYEPLDIVFDVSKKAKFVISEEKITDDKGNETKYRVYQAQTIDEFGLIYSCDIKPARNSDKALLDMLVVNLDFINKDKN